MGVFEFPCPGCGTPQKIRAPAGQEVNTQALCAACAEKKANEARDKEEDHKEAEHGAKARTR